MSNFRVRQVRHQHLVQGLGLLRELEDATSMSGFEFLDKRISHLEEQVAELRRNDESSASASSRS
jgi:hypothetical protein